MYPSVTAAFHWVFASTGFNYFQLTGKAVPIPAGIIPGPTPVPARAPAAAVQTPGTAPTPQAPAPAAAKPAPGQNSPKSPAAPQKKSAAPTPAPTPAAPATPKKEVKPPEILEDKLGEAALAKPKSPGTLSTLWAKVKGWSPFGTVLADNIFSAPA